MATTYTLISSNVLTSSAASVTFSSIPATYTDLVLKCSMRSTESGAANAVFVEFNGSGGTDYSYTRLVGTGSAASSARLNDYSQVVGYLNVVASGATSNIFSNTEFYIPNYSVSQNKPFSGFSVTEDNATDAYAVATAALWRNTATISSIKLTSSGGSNFVSGSSFYLYGISNA